MKKTETGDVPPTEQSSMFDLIDLGNDLLTSSVQINSNLYQTLFSINLEMVNFISHRLEVDMETAKKVVSSQTPRIYNDYLMEFYDVAAHEYVSEATKIFNLSSSIKDEVAEATLKTVK